MSERNWTPTPWEVESPMGDYLSIVVGGEAYDWRFVAHVHTDIDKGSSVKPIGKAQMAANAARIVHCVNTYDALVDALREMVRTCADCDGSGRVRRSVGPRIEINCPVCLGGRQALALAEGGENG